MMPGTNERITVYKSLTKKEYEASGFGANSHVDATYAQMCAVLGQPLAKNQPIRKNAAYPDDDHKTDVCWGIRDKKGNTATIWNYKNGPAYCGKDVPNIEDIDGFSIGSNSPELIKELEGKIAAAALATK